MGWLLGFSLSLKVEQSILFKERKGLLQLDFNCQYKKGELIIASKTCSSVPVCALNWKRIKKDWEGPLPVRFTAKRSGNLLHQSCVGVVTQHLIYEGLAHEKKLHNCLHVLIYMSYSDITFLRVSLMWNNKKKRFSFWQENCTQQMQKHDFDVISRPNQRLTKGHYR